MISVDWTKNLSDKKDKQEFEQIVRNSITVLNRLREIIIEYDTALTKSELNRENYDSPSWSHKQADAIGERRGLRRILNLITLDQKENNDPRR